MRLDNLAVSKLIPRILFLDCAIYEWSRTTEGDDTYAWLVEKRLNPAKYVKWNDNKGGVDGIAVDVGVLLHEAPHEEEVALDTIEEGDEDEEDNELVQIDGGPTFATSLLVGQMLPCDIPQAFSHFSYVVSQRRELVCDLQGELGTTDGRCIFEFTDPCIHADGKKYGKTDHGDGGMRAFFKTHRCNAVCALLKIDRGKYERDRVR